ncbi:uncharacterized protein LOC143007785 [Genypterus blacodes]|uniref:uncharacterized protein LOC143007785 n=1 Tax=Genypterus blacodes TaxID=154954 RepID=UPI003F7759A2
MPAFSPPAPVLCVLLCVLVALQRCDLRLAYVTHSSLFYCSCAHDPQPCSLLSPADCSCKDLSLSTLHRPQSHSSPVFRTRRLTVWYTSTSNTAHLLNSSEVRHLTLIRCGPGASRVTESKVSGSQEGTFAVHHLERLTVVSLKAAPDGSRGRNTDSNADPEGDNSARRETNRYVSSRNRDSYMDFDEDTNRKSDAPAFESSSSQIQDILLGRELGAMHHEQARLGIIHSSVLDSGAAVKAYTVQTHIDSDGVLPFPDLHLPKLPETSIIYVSFIY